MIKHSLFRSFLFVIAITLLGGQTRADETTARLYLPIDSVDVETLIGPPPELDSVAFDEQLAIVLWLQKTRTPAQVTFVETTLDVERFAAVLGDALFTVDGIELKKTIDDAIDDARAEYDSLKALYDLPRPFVVDDRVKPIGDARPVASYPSGHAIRAVIYARLLSEVFPEHKEALMDLAIRVGYGRVIAGVHYPVDITSGQSVGHAFADVIVEQPAFEQAMERIFGRQPPSRVTTD